MTKPKIQISPSTQGYFQLGMGHMDYYQPGVATGDPRISRRSPKYKGVGWDAALLMDQVTTHFPSHLFGHGNTKHLFP